MVFDYVSVRSTMFEILYVRMRIVVFRNVFNANSNHAPLLRNFIGVSSTQLGRSLPGNNSIRLLGGRKGR